MSPLNIICPGCGKEFDPTPKKGNYQGGRYHKYCNDTCRKRATRQALKNALPIPQHEPTIDVKLNAQLASLPSVVDNANGNNNDNPDIVAARKRTAQPENGQVKIVKSKRVRDKRQFWVFDWEADYYGPLVERDALRIVKLIKGQLFEATSYSHASELYAKFIRSGEGQSWLYQFYELYREKRESDNK